MKAARLALLLSAAALAAQPREDPGALSDQAGRLAAEKRFEEAEKLWRRALDLSPDFFPALFNLGYLHFSQGHYAEAEPWLSRAARVRPEDFNTRYTLGVALVRLGRRDDGLRQWRAALRLQPENVRLMQVMIVEYSKGRYFHEAAQLARRVLDLKSDDPNPYFLAIKANQDAGDYAAALEVARQAVGKFPESARANFEYGFHLQKVGRIEESVGFLQKAMAADPAYEEPPFFYGDLLVKQGRNEEALTFLRAAIRNRNDYVPARVTLARALMNLQRWEEAVKELEETIRLDPKHPQPHLLLSQVYFRLGDEEHAAKEREISLRLRRESPALLEAVQGRPFPP